MYAPVGISTWSNSETESILDDNPVFDFVAVGAEEEGWEPEILTAANEEPVTDEGEEGGEEEGGEEEGGEEAAARILTAANGEKVTNEKNARILEA